MDDLFKVNKVFQCFIESDHMCKVKNMYECFQDPTLQFSRVSIDRPQTSMRSLYQGTDKLYHEIFSFPFLANGNIRNNIYMQ